MDVTFVLNSGGNQNQNRDFFNFSGKSQKCILKTKQVNAKLFICLHSQVFCMQQKHITCATECF